MPSKKTALLCCARCSAPFVVLDPRRHGQRYCSVACAANSDEVKAKRRATLSKPHEAVPDPTAEELAERTAAVRAGWDDRKRARRAGAMPKRAGPRCCRTHAPRDVLRALDRESCHF